MNFANSGNGFCGYYSRFGATPCAPDHGVNGNYIDTKTDWLNTYAPGTSRVMSFTNGNRGADLLTDFIGPELQAHEDIELFIYQLGSTTVGHVISPFSITYDPGNPNGGGFMSYQDPNFPTVQQMIDFIINSSGQIQFADPASGLGTVTVTAGFSESPIPEPGTLGLLAIALAAAAKIAMRPRRAK